MVNFFVTNWGTILVGAVVAAAVITIAVKMYRDKKRGRSSCGCGCDSCPSSGICHKK